MGTHANKEKIWAAVIVTVCAIAGLPGMRPFAELLTQFYGPYGYSISVSGVVAGAMLGFSEGFVHFGIFGVPTENQIRTY